MSRWPLSRTPLKSGPEPSRDPVLDVIRSLALVRVVVWHLFAASWMTWIASIPVMFFATGTLLRVGNQAFTAADHWSFLKRRLRRILLPFWVYGATVAVGLNWLSTAHKDSPGNWRSLLPAFTWVLPFVDPVSTGWRGGWLSSHLWYLRAYLWILAAAPVLGWLSRRLGRSLVSALMLLAGLEFVRSGGAGISLPSVGFEYLGDLLVYGSFALVGVWYAKPDRKLPDKPWMVGLFISAASGAGWVGLSGRAPTQGVNDSYLLLVLVGAAWLLGLALIEPSLRRLAGRPAVSRVARRISSRSLTIYLWHPLCIVVARSLNVGNSPWSQILLLGITSALIGVCVAIVGWVENAATGHGLRKAEPNTSAQRRPIVRLFMLIMCLASAAGLPILNQNVVSAAASLSTEAAGDFDIGIPAPSARAGLSDSAFSATASRPTSVGVADSVRGPDSARGLDSAEAPESLALNSDDALEFAVPLKVFGARPRGDATGVTSAPSNNKPSVAKSSLKKSSLKKSSLKKSSFKKSSPKKSSPKTSPATGGANAAATKSATASAKKSQSTSTANVAANSVPKKAATTGAPSNNVTAKNSTISNPPTNDPTSGKPNPSTDQTSAGRTSDESPLSDPVVTKRLQVALDRWRASQQPVISSVTVSMRIGKSSWSATSATDKRTSQYRDDAAFPIASITKSFTAALVVREVEKGTIQLDDPVSAISGIGDPLPSGLTVRRLLTHTSGLTDYQLAPGYRADQPLTAKEAVSLSLRAPLQSGVGKEVHYANVNFLYLGLLLEQVTGRSYADLVREISDLARLTSTRVSDESKPGWVGLSSGSIWATADDLSKWGQALLSPNGPIVGERGLSLLTSLDASNLSAGLWPACPCSTDSAGVKRYAAIGHHNATGGMFYFPNDKTTVVAMFEPTGEDTHGRIVSLKEALTDALTGA